MTCCCDDDDDNNTQSIVGQPPSPMLELPCGGVQEWDEQSINQRGKCVQRRAPIAYAARMARRARAGTYAMFMNMNIRARADRYSCLCCALHKGPNSRVCTYNMPCEQIMRHCARGATQSKAQARFFRLLVFFFWWLLLK